MPPPSKGTAVVTDTGKVLITPALGIAGQVAFTMTYSDRSKAMLVGSTYGKPGPVTLIMQKWVSRIGVDNPERFGTSFNEQWVINYVTGREVSRCESEQTKSSPAT